jgi:hypothetical protein
MMKIAREMNLSETVFVLKPESDEVCDVCASSLLFARFRSPVIRLSAPGRRSQAKE